MIEINIPKQAPHLWQKQLLALALIEQMTGNYVLFTEVSGQGDSKVFSNITDLIWQQLLGHSVKVDWQKQRAKLEAISPAPESFDGYGVWPALDACAALSELITLLDESNSGGLESVIKTYYSTIEQFLDVHDLNEDTRQQTLYEEADNLIDKLLTVLSAEVKQMSAVKAIKEIVQSQAVSNIGIEHQLE